MVFDSVVLEVEDPGDVAPVVDDVVVLEVDPVPLDDVSELLEVLGAGAGAGVVTVVLLEDDVAGGGAGVGTGVTVVVLVSRVRSVHPPNAAAKTAAVSATPSAFVVVCFIISPRSSESFCRSRDGRDHAVNVPAGSSSNRATAVPVWTGHNHCCMLDPANQVSHDDVRFGTD